MFEIVNINMDNVSVKENLLQKKIEKQGSINADDRIGLKEESKSSILEKESIKTPKISAVEKKRPIKKEILEARAAFLNKNNGEEYSKRVNTDQGKRTFTIFLKSPSLEFIKDLVFYKATVERQIFYNQSEAISEGLELLKPEFINIVPRPEFIREQEKNKKGGRKRNSDEIFDSSTTVYISGQYFDFIKDVTYNKVVSGDLYYKDWDLLESAIELMREKYGNNVKPRPDYIREEEKMRGKRKADS